VRKENDEYRITNVEGMNSINYIMIERSDSSLRYSAVRFSGPTPRREGGNIRQRAEGIEFGIRNLECGKWDAEFEKAGIWQKPEAWGEENGHWVTGNG
jgi:hypothetical protein